MHSGGGLRELPLPRCIEIWGLEISLGINKPSTARDSDSRNVESPDSANFVNVRGQQVRIPIVPEKFIKFVQARRKIYRNQQYGQTWRSEAAVMLGSFGAVHDSRIPFFSSQCDWWRTFDRIKVEGTEEETARTRQTIFERRCFCISGVFATVIKTRGYCWQRRG